MISLDGVRKAVLVRLIRYFAPGPPAKTGHDEVLHVPSRDPERTIKVHFYRNDSGARPTPLLINFHGSGYVIPSHGSDDGFAVQIKQQTSYSVFDVQYRLAPEHPFPAAPNDAEDVVRYVLRHGDRFDLTRIALSGFSAGGALALGLCGHTFPSTTFRHAILFYPPTDLARPASSKVPPDQAGRPLPAWLTSTFDDCYAPSPIDRSDPLISPSFIPPSNFTKSMLFITCAYDTLATEAQELANSIAAQPDHKVTHVRYERCNHAWDKAVKLGHEQEAKTDAYDRAVALLREEAS